MNGSILIRRVILSALAAACDVAVHAAIDFR
jgi:hypothetical protein